MLMDASHGNGIHSNFPQGIPFPLPSPLPVFTEFKYIHSGGKINNSCWLSFAQGWPDEERGWDEYGMGIVRRIP